MKTANSKAALIEMLCAVGIKPTTQRLSVLEYISSCESHPTAEQVYQHLVHENPTLSRATVFNNLRLLSDKGLVNDINILPDSTRYDSAAFARHAHFMCRVCRRIFDIPFDMSSIEMPQKFQCDNVNVFFKGICPHCAAKSSE